MRRYVYLMVVLLAFTGIACPPAPPPIDPPKKENGEAKARTKVNAIQYICDGGELSGLKFEPTKDGLDVYTSMAGELQFLAQGHQDQFIAEMTQWGMKRNHPFRVGKKDYTFEDFIRHSTMRASVAKHKDPKKDQELSWAIIIIGQFHGTNYEWTNSLGERLRYEQVVQYELDASIDEAACGGTHRLFGLTWAYLLHLKNGGKKEGVWLDVAAKIDRYKALAKQLQNRDGTFSTDYFKGPGSEADPIKRISTTGHILEWLALATTDEELRAPWMQNAVNALVLLILDLKDGPADGGSLYHAAHGLHLYRERVFGIPAAYLPLETKKAALPPDDVAALKPRLEGALEKVHSRELTTKHGFWTVFHGILGMGLENTMLTIAK